MSTDVQNSVIECMEEASRESTLVGLAAIEAFRNVPDKSQIKSYLLDHTISNDNPELAIAAYLAIMRSATFEDINKMDNLWERVALHECKKYSG